MSIAPASSRYYRLFQVSFLTLPYLFFISFVGLLTVIVGLLKTHKRSALDPITRNSLLILSGLLILSSCLAENRGEAFLQLANFLPYFLFFAVLPYVMQPIERLEKLTGAIVIATIPINLLALVEYILRSNSIPRSIRRIPIVRWLRQRPHTGRAMVMFTHPNSLANYLVVVLGLGLGLILCHLIHQRLALSQRSSDRFPDHSSDRLLSNRDAIVVNSSPKSFPISLLYLGTFLNLVGIFSSGSRSGLVIAGSQIILFCLLSRANRWVALAGLGSLLIAVAGAAGWGIGGRSLDLSTWVDDPRWRVWRVAIDLIQERPWWGWGLGNYKFEFSERLLALYPSCEPLRQLNVIPVACADVGHPHNFWLLLGAEAGLPILLLFTALIGYLYGRGVMGYLSRQLPPIDQAVLLAYLLAFWGCITCALFDITLYDARLNATSWFVLAGIYTITIRHHFVQANPK